MTITRFGAVFVGLLFVPIAATAGQGAATPDQRVAALKQSLQESQQRLRKLEWIETTIISLKGEEKARTHKRCYYGADGKVQKIAMDEPKPAAAPPSGKRGARLKAKVVENKKSDIQEYMERAAALIHQYVPPAPAQIQKVKDAGKLAIKPIDAARVRLELKDYLQAGDLLAIDVNSASNSLAALSVATYLDKAEDTVALAVKWGSLQDGTGYVAQTTLDAKAKNIQVVIQNSGHRPLTQ
jgi:hypothetical protein